MIETLKDELGTEEISSFHDALLKECKSKISMSRSKMQDYYWRWDKSEAVYRGELECNEADLKAIKRSEPVRIIDPLTHAQVNTFVAIVYALYTQRPSFFEIEGTGPEDHNPAKIIEALLEYDLDYNNFKGSVLGQALRSIGKRGLGILKYYWYEDCTYEEEEEELGVLGKVLEGFGMEQEKKKSWQKFTQFRGNKLENQDPYKFFPDPRVPLSRFQEGEFCGSEDEYSYNYLQRREFEGRYAGVKFIRDVNLESREDPYQGRRISFQDQVDYMIQNGTGGGDRPKLPIIVTQVQLDIVPSTYELSNGEMLGKETYPVKYLVEYANDHRIINVEKLPYRRFTYEVGQFLEDESEYVGQGISDVLEHLQDLISWLINTRVTNIRKVIQTKLIVDPVALDIDDLSERRPIIKMTPAATGRDIRQFIHQLQLQDVTVNNIQDVGLLRQISKEATGISDNLVGQFASGRRSAQEAASVNQNALARVKIHADAIWDTMFKPMCRGMIYNHRKFLDDSILLKVKGLHNVDPQTGQLTPTVQTMLSVSKAELEGAYDLKVYEGSTPSERGQRAAQIFEMLKIAIQNPEAFLQIFQINPTLLAKEWLYLTGSENLSSLGLTFPQLQQMIAPYMAEKAMEFHNEQARLNKSTGEQPNMAPTPSPIQGGEEVSPIPTPQLGGVTPEQSPLPPLQM